MRQLQNIISDYLWWMQATHWSWELTKISWKKLLLWVSYKIILLVSWCVFVQTIHYIQVKVFHKKVIASLEKKWDKSGQSDTFLLVRHLVISNSSPNTRMCTPRLICVVTEIKMSGQSDTSLLVRHLVIPNCSPNTLLCTPCLSVICVATEIKMPK